MRKETDNSTLTTLLKKALADRPGSYRAIEAATGVPHPSLIRFLAGKQSLRLDHADALAAYFGIRHVPPKAKQRARAKKG